jgi:signal peptidase I
MYLLVALFILLFLLRRFLVIITVCGRSMEPTLTDGDRVLLLRSRLFLRRKQIVVCRSPDLPSARQMEENGEQIRGLVTDKVARYFRPSGKQPYYIKRLWGLGGDRIEMPFAEVTARARPQTISSPEQDDKGNFIWQIPAGYCFVKGDSIYSYDSTSWGPIHLACLVGIVLWQLPRRADKLHPEQNNPT